jgi:hypothetical protein
MSRFVEDPPTVPEGLEEDAAVVGAWLRAQGLGDARYRVLIGAFTAGYLKSLPLPKRKFKAGNFTIERCVRNL